MSFPPPAIHRKLKEGRYADHVTKGAAVYLGAVLEYLVAEMIEIAGNRANTREKKRIWPRDLQAVREDEELNRLIQSLILKQDPEPL